MELAAILEADRRSHELFVSMHGKSESEKIRELMQEIRRSSPSVSVNTKKRRQGKGKRPNSAA
jgi:hypothetical protein